MIGFGPFWSAWRPSTDPDGFDSDLLFLCGAVLLLVIAIWTVRP